MHAQWPLPAVPATLIRSRKKTSRCPARSSSVPSLSHTEGPTLCADEHPLKALTSFQLSNSRHFSTAAGTTPLRCLRAARRRGLQPIGVLLFPRCRTRLCRRSGDWRAATRDSTNQRASEAGYDAGKSVEPEPNRYPAGLPVVAAEVLRGQGAGCSLLCGWYRVLSTSPRRNPASELPRKLVRTGCSDPPLSLSEARTKSWSFCQVPECGEWMLLV